MGLLIVKKNRLAKRDLLLLGDSFAYICSRRIRGAVCMAVLLSYPKEQTFESRF